MKKRIVPNGIAVDQAATLPSPLRGGSQTGSHRSGCRPRESSRKWGLYLVRRNKVFYFRRRWPEKLRQYGAPAFLSVSLRTQILSEAVKRSVDLLSAVEAGEKDVLRELEDNAACDARVQATLKEIVRRAMATMIARQESDASGESSEACLRRIDAETCRIRDAQRTRDWKVASGFAGSIAQKNGLDPNTVETPAVARQVLALLRRLNELSARVERDLDDPLHVGRELLEDHGLKPTRDALKPPMLLSEAIEKACGEAPQGVEGKIRVIGKLALAYFGDVPVSSILLEQSYQFLRTVWMLPKGWGKAHGRNRHGHAGRDMCPLQEIRDADEKDAELLEEIMSLDMLSMPDKRRRLVQELTPRLTDGYLFVQRDMLNRIFRAALGRKRVGRDVDDEDRVVPSHAQLKARMHAWHKSQKTPCKLPKRVSRPKRRMSWSLEHVSRLLRSPIYLGTSSPKQRSRKATARKRVIIRDAIYWVPLFMITMGVRPEEILQAAVPDVVRRDGILCLFIGDEEDAVLKSEQSRRVLPIPQILLDLGFREWIVAKRKFGETWLFPEIQPDISHGRRSQIFGDRLRNLLKTLKLHDPREDIYAMRRTLSSKLMGLGIDTGTRQRILGHLEGTTIDRHYSDHGLLELKDLLDSVDYGIEVGSDRRFDFPIIVGNRTTLLTALDVEVALTERREISAIQLRDAETDEIVFEAAVSGRKAPAGFPWNDCEALSEKDVAARIISLGREYSLTMPANEEATGALEHLLILVDDKPFYNQVRREDRLADNHEAKPNNDLGDEPRSVADKADLRTADLCRGDLVIGLFPTRNAGSDSPAPRPGLVVDTRTLAGQTYLDVAWGGPIGPSRAAPHELVLTQPKEMLVAQIDIPTRFNLRRRILVPAESKAFLHGRLGRIGEGACTRLRECLIHAGDVSPTPFQEANRPVRALTIERRRTKSVRPRASR
ncbi:MAG: DUF6538 domain-containing protein [Sulfitobacter sp.]|uniref:DUF6538 domain-containing protein n=1 Tax=Sulfitobacter sp. TaxID=1903071 RepID=UPI003263FE86